LSESDAGIEDVKTTVNDDDAAQLLFRAEAKTVVVTPPAKNLEAAGTEIVTNIGLTDPAAITADAGDTVTKLPNSVVKVMGTGLFDLHDGVTVTVAEPPSTRASDVTLNVNDGVVESRTVTNVDAVRPA
jgi:hypothetical protein